MITINDYERKRLHLLNSNKAYGNTIIKLVEKCVDLDEERLEEEDA